MTALRAFFLFLALAVTGTAAHAQSTLLQAGAISAGHVPMYVNPYSQQPIVMDSGPASGGGPGIGLSELGMTERGAGTPPFANAGTGPYGTNNCDYDAPITNSTGYHYLCFGPNAQGGALIAYGAGGGAASLPFQFIINGNTYTLPFTGSSVTFSGQSVNSLLASGNVSMTLAGTALTVGSPAVGTFSTLATCVSGIEGELRPVSDSTTNTWGATITGSGSNHVLAYCDGSSWTVAGK